MSRQLQVGDAATITFDGIVHDYIIREVVGNGIIVSTFDFPGIRYLLVPQGDNWIMHGVKRPHKVVFSALEMYNLAHSHHEDKEEKSAEPIGQIVFRELTAADDQELIKGIWQEALYDSQTSRESTAKYIALMLRDDMKDIYRSYSGKNGRFFLALDGDKLAGFVGVLKKEGVYYLQRMNVRSTYRGMGIATELTKIVIEWVKIQGQKEVYATVDKNNEASIKTLRKSHFEYLRPVRGNIVLMVHKISK